MVHRILLSISRMLISFTVQRMLISFMVHWILISSTVHPILTLSLECWYLIYCTINIVSISLLQKRPKFLGSLLVVATPYHLLYIQYCLSLSLSLSISLYLSLSLSISLYLSLSLSIPLYLSNVDIIYGASNIDIFYYASNILFISRMLIWNGYGVATISRMLKNIGLFCKRDLQKRPIFCKETYIFKHPTHRSHPIRLAGCLKT